MPAKRVRGMCFTHNNYEEGDVEKIIAGFKEEARYIIVGREKGGECSTPHLQGYISFADKVGLKSRTNKLAELLGKRAHCEQAKGSPRQNFEYCSKDGDYVEYGERPQQGKRMDLEAAYEDARSDMPMIDVADTHRSTFIRYHKGIEKVRELHNAEQAKAWRDVKVIVHSGPTGCGKTKAAMEHDAEARAPYKIQGADLKWWDGYEGEDVVVIDEYSNSVPIDKLLALLDGYKLRLPIKGGHTYARWTTVHITTNLRREELHEQAKEKHKRALDRRIAEWKDYWQETPWTKAAKASAMEIDSKGDWYMEGFSDENGNLF